MELEDRAVALEGAAAQEDRAVALAVTDNAEGPVALEDRVVELVGERGGRVGVWGGRVRFGRQQSWGWGEGDYNGRLESMKSEDATDRLRLRYTH